MAGLEQNGVDLPNVGCRSSSLRAPELIPQSFGSKDARMQNKSDQFSILRETLTGLFALEKKVPLE